MYRRAAHLRQGSHGPLPLSLHTLSLVSSSLPISTVAGHWEFFGEGAEGAPGAGDVVEALQAEPEAFGTGFTVALAAQKAAESGYHAHRFAHRRRLAWG